MNKNKQKKRGGRGGGRQAGKRNKIKFSCKRDLKEMDRAKQPCPEVRKRLLRLPCPWEHYGHSLVHLRGDKT